MSHNWKPKNGGDVVVCTRCEKRVDVSSGDLFNAPEMLGKCLRACLGCGKMAERPLCTGCDKPAGIIEPVRRGRRVCECHRVYPPNAVPATCRQCGRRIEVRA